MNTNTTLFDPLPDVLPYQGKHHGSKRPSSNIRNENRARNKRARAARRIQRRKSR